MVPLESPDSPARRTPAAQHEDALSPAKVIRDRAEEAPSQRIGNNTVAGNPVVSFPED
ncbi:MAG TPA: hypothetical protein VNO23_12950 [Candidatus Binatia bacterium]|nr:hypothetical protein [Candidatus Binatia bacterium]